MVSQPFTGQWLLYFGASKRFWQRTTTTVIGWLAGRNVKITQSPTLLCSFFMVYIYFTHLKVGSITQTGGPRVVYPSTHALCTNFFLSSFLHFVHKMR
jgi:hypothetical protein